MTVSSSSVAASERAPTVLAVLVVRDAIGWLRESLSSLSAQTYPRLGVLAVDNASADGSRELLVRALGDRRVLALPEDRGLAGSLRAALEIPAAREADYLLLLHDDAVLDPDAVMRLVEAAVGIRGVRDVGIVGTKVVDYDDARLLLDVGRSADRFGHPYTPLQPGEIDQGQFDRVLEVLCVSSCAMLVSREAWQRTGLFDDRLDSGHEDLDFCWRARLAGFRVLMTPLARARHRAASAAGDRVTEHRRRSERYYEDRAAVASMLKNYKLLSLLWLLPLALALGVVRLLYLVVTRRLEEALDLLAAWGWNLAHLPGTISRRVRAQSVRRVPDRALHRFMESAGLRLPRWFAAAERILEEQREIDEEDENVTTGRRLRDRTASLVGAHPVVVTSLLAVIVGGVAFRRLLGPGSLHGGVLPAFPASADGFFAELLSGFRTTGLGGTLAASPSLGAMGALSWVLFGSTALAQKVLLGAAPFLGALFLYRAVARITGRAGAAVVAAASYGVSAVMLWAISQGRVDLLVALAVLPLLADRLEVAFGRQRPPGRRLRFIVAIGVPLAVGVAFVPGVLVAGGLLVLSHLIAGSSRGRGLVLACSGALVAGLLLFPFVPTIAAGGGAALGSLVGTTNFARLDRLALGPGPGTWMVSAFLPIAAVLSLALVGRDHRGPAARATLTALGALALAWLSAAGYLPRALTNAPIYVGTAAVAEAMIVGLALASAMGGLGREAFGLRQVWTALLALVLGVGLLLQSVAAMIGSWAIGGAESLPPAWAIVSSRERGDFRVLWVGASSDQPFSAPGGDPEAIEGAGAASVRYRITGRDGTTALDVGRPITGPGADYAAGALNEILSGTTVHGGALLAPLGVRFVVAGEGDLPPAARTAFDSQVDLNLVGAVGLVIYRNATALPKAAVLPAARGVAGIVPSSELSTISRLPQVAATPLDRVIGGWRGRAPSEGLIAVSTQFSNDWRLQSAGSTAAPREAFGWSTWFPTSAGTVRITYTAQWMRTLEIIALGLLWLAALWITRRRPASG